MTAKVVIGINSVWNVVNFRSNLIKAMVAAGYDVVVMAPVDEHLGRLELLGCRFVPLPMDNKGTHPVRDLLLLWRFYSSLRQERPDVYLGYTIKPNIYGSLAARLLGIPVSNNITGLGAVFIRGGWLSRFVCALYKVALSRSSKVFFQNDDDKEFFVSGGLVDPGVSERLPGSGIDLVEFSPVSLPCNEPIRFVLIARMLIDKGVCEFVEAAHLLKQEGVVQAEFCLLGSADVLNPAAIPRAKLDAWIAEGDIMYLGTTDNIRAEIELAHCIVLPSYREGVPRALLEAAAMGRPIVATNVAGCRDVVEDGSNGYLCAPKDADDLAKKMKKVALLSREEQTTMGIKGRAKIEHEFDDRIVIQKYLESIKKITNE